MYNRWMPLIALSDVTLGFRGPPVLDQANLTIEPGERVCLLGRNGTGKTTLLRLLQGGLEPDRGEVIRQQGLRTAMLPQQVPQDLARLGLRRGRAGVRTQGGAAGRVSSPGEPAGQRGKRRPAGRVGPHPTRPGGRRRLAACTSRSKPVVSRMSLQPDADVATLSAGMKRRVLLAKAVVGSPDLLLVGRADQPPRHRRHPLAGGFSAALRRHAAVRDARSGLAPQSGDPHPGTRPRPAHKLVVRLRHVPESQRGGPGSREPAERRVRQEAGPGRGLDPHRHPGPADPQRRPGPRPGGPARSPPRPPRSPRRRENGDPGGPAHGPAGDRGQATPFPVRRAGPSSATSRR